MISQTTILFCEDDDNYAALFKHVFEQGGFKQTLQHVTDGAEAMMYLKGEGKYERSIYPLPYVGPVDLKMPRVNGFELLDWIRRSSTVPHLPVVVLSNSDELKDVSKAYELGANSFLMKPPQLDDLKDMLTMLNTYWLKLNVRDAKLPKGTSPSYLFPMATPLNIGSNPSLSFPKREIAPQDPIKPGAN